MTLNKAEARRTIESLNAVGSQVDRGVGRLVPKRAKPLSYRQAQLLLKAPAEWDALPGGVGCTNATLEALERRGLVEKRIEPTERLHWYGGWQWRKTPNVI